MMAPLLLELWTEQHPRCHEQPALDFGGPLPGNAPVPLIAGELPDTMGS